MGCSCCCCCCCCCLSLDVIVLLLVVGGRPPRPTKESRHALMQRTWARNAEILRCSTRAAGLAKMALCSDQWRPHVGLPSLCSPRGCDWLQPCRATEVLGPRPAQISVAHRGKGPKARWLMSDLECGTPIMSFSKATPGFQHYSLHVQASCQHPGGMDQGSAATADSYDPVDVQHFPATDLGGLEPTEDSYHLHSEAAAAGRNSC